MNTEGWNQKNWDCFLSDLTPQEACRLCGVDHFPSWLASAANVLLLAEYLESKYPADMPVRMALQLEIQKNNPDPKSEQADWWLAMQHVEHDLEVFAYLQCTGKLVPFSDSFGV